MRRGKMRGGRPRQLPRRGSRSGNRNWSQQGRRVHETYRDLTADEIIALAAKEAEERDKRIDEAAASSAPLGADDESLGDTYMDDG